LGKAEKVNKERSPKKSPEGRTKKGDLSSVRRKGEKYSKDEGK